MTAPATTQEALLWAHLVVAVEAAADRLSRVPRVLLYVDHERTMASLTAPDGAYLHVRVTRELVSVSWCDGDGGYRLTESTPRTRQQEGDVAAEVAAWASQVARCHEEEPEAPAGTVGDADEASALPAGTIVRDADGTVWEARHLAHDDLPHSVVWSSTDSSEGHSDAIAFPARTLYVPNGERGTSCTSRYQRRHGAVQNTIDRSGR